MNISDITSEPHRQNVLTARIQRLNCTEKTSESHRRRKHLNLADKFYEPNG